MFVPIKEHRRAAASNKWCCDHCDMVLLVVVVVLNVGVGVCYGVGWMDSIHSIRGSTYVEDPHIVQCIECMFIRNGEREGRKEETFNRMRYHIYIYILDSLQNAI